MLIEVGNIIGQFIEFVHCNVSLDSWNGESREIVSGFILFEIGRPLGSVILFSLFSSILNCMPSLITMINYLIFQPFSSIILLSYFIN
jgi:hypothetical protein